MQNIQPIIDEIAADMGRSVDRGKVADYIPELAKQSTEQFAIAVSTVDGNSFASGDTAAPFSIQSISKVFLLTMALGKAGAKLWRRVGREPSGSPFNSIVQLEHELGVPRNPFINAGAIVVTDLVLAGHQPKETIGEILQFIRRSADDENILIDPAVAMSETETGFRNAALANYMKSFGNLEHPVELTLGVYFHQCAITMNVMQLARAGLYLANEGTDPITGISVISKKHTRRINAVMLTCGHYDGSGEFAFSIGLPGKSGVAGGILAVAPGKASIAVWSPGLDPNGNSRLGKVALEMLVERTGWSIFGS